MAKVVIIKHKATGQEERATPDQAERLKASKHADLFEFVDVVEPPEVSNTEGDENQVAEAPKRKK